jgi:POT family proton-dependent oligopeptide transporter
LAVYLQIVTWACEKQSFLAVGHFGIAVEGSQTQYQNSEFIRDESALQVFYFSMALIIVGVGFLKPDIVL